MTEGSNRDGPRILFDVSRLVARIHRASPTGIDRVDLIHAQRLLASGLTVEPVAFLGGTLRRLDRDLVAAYVARIAAQWRQPAVGNDAAEEARIATFLAGDAGRAGPAVARGGPGLPPPAAPEPTGAAAWVDGATWRRRLIWLGLTRGRWLLPRAPIGPSNDRTATRRTVYWNLSHHHLEKPALFAALDRAGPIERVIFVHDVIPLDFPEYCRAGDDRKHAARLDNVVAGATTVLVNSQHTRERVLAFAGGKARRDLPVTVAPLGLDDGLAGGAPFPSPVPYFVCLGTIEARKNHLLLLQVWRRLVETLGTQAPKLVVVGRRGWEIEAVIDMLERCRTLRGHVIETGPIGDRALGRLMAGARALLMPSFAEGFGLPVVEALAAGVPVIASDIPAHREFGGAVPDYLDPIDGPGWAAAILDHAAADDPRRQAQLARLPGFRAPDWTAHFAAVAEATGIAF